VAGEPRTSLASQGVLTGIGAPFSIEAIAGGVAMRSETKSDDDRLENVTIHLRDVVFYTLLAMAWPRSASVRAWQEESFVARLEAARMAAAVKHPRHISCIHVAVIYASALRQVAREHQEALALDPDSAEAQPPQPLPQTCRVTLRQLLDVSVDLSLALAWPVPSPV
jgi:hypothetical protein